MTQRLQRQTYRDLRLARLRDFLAARHDRRESYQRLADWLAQVEGIHISGDELRRYLRSTRRKEPPRDRMESPTAS